ncbi:MAG: hypothetical protein IPP88_22620 [Betaproteobacteria bacterium]|nr:hypothetical protein [Betaproteobacteria bacterium]
MTIVFCAKAALQVLPQEMPAGFEVTSPVPLPAGVTQRLTDAAGCSVNVATQLKLEESRTCVPVVAPVQLPDHPAKLDPALAVAESVTLVLVAKLLVHALPHEMPGGFVVTDPVPVPALLTDKLDCNTGDGVATAPLNAKDALHVALPLFTYLMVVEVPLQAPDHPVNSEPVLGVAVMYTFVYRRNRYLHALPHEIPTGVVDLTTPLPAPVLLTVSVGYRENVAADDSSAMVGANATKNQATLAM